MRPLFIALLILPTALRAEVPRVATDIAPVHSLVSTVMEGVGTPSLLIPPGASPHSYAMRPSEARGVARADLVVWVGPQLTPWLSDPLAALAPEAEKLALMNAPEMRLLSFREGAGFGGHDHDDHDAHGSDAHDEEGHDDDAHDAKHHDEDADGHDKHGEDKHGDDEHAHDEHADTTNDDHKVENLDPHIWLDPKNGGAAMDAIAETLARMDPENAATYAANATRGKARLAELTTELTATLTPARGHPFIVFHDAYHYFEARFDIEATAAVSAGDAASPGAARVASLRDHVLETGAVCAFAEPQMNAKLLDAITEGQTRLGVFDPLGAMLEPGPALYEGLLRGMAQSAATCLDQ